MLSVSNLLQNKGTLQVYDLTGRIIISRNFSAENQQWFRSCCLEDGIFLLVVLDLAGEQVGRVLFTKQ